MQNSRVILEICSQCNKLTFIQNRKKVLCGDCVFKNNHGGKSQIEVYREREFNRKKKQVFKKTGERDLFLEIWEERPHICTNCKEELGREPRTYMFSHIKSKGSDSSKRLSKDNIELLCFDCHFAYEFQGSNTFNKRKR